MINNLYLNDVAYVGMGEFVYRHVRCVHLYPCLKKIGDYGFFAPDLKTVVYHGTQQQWDAVVKGYDCFPDRVKVEIEP